MSTPGMRTLQHVVAQATELALDSSLSEQNVTAQIRKLTDSIEQLQYEEVSWPVLRRSIVASLVLRALQHGPFTSDQQTNAESLLLTLFQQHTSTSRRKRVVEFAHVSKSGGSTFCQLAELNGCRTEGFSLSRNCLIPEFRDQPRYVNQTVHNALRGGNKTKCNKPVKAMVLRNDISCGERRRRLLSKKFTIYANEYTAFGGRTDPELAHPCTNMVTVLQLRHPHSRVLSHIKHVWSSYQRHCRADRHFYFDSGHDTAHWSALLPAPTNNYLIRSLLGEAVFNLPAGGITREHLELARTLLAQQYDVLLVLEDGDLSGRVMRYGLGWHHDLHELHANEQRPDPEDGLPADLEPLWELNTLDVELYDFGVVMAKLDAVVYDAVHAAGAAARAAAGVKVPLPLAAAPAGAAASEGEGKLGAGEGAASWLTQRLGRSLMSGLQWGGSRRRLEEKKSGRDRSGSGASRLPACGWVAQP